MLSALERLNELTQRIDRSVFDSDWVIQNAVLRELEVLGEAAGRVSAQFAATHPEIPWKEITGLRHKLIHDYFAVDLSIVWRTVTVNVPQVLPVVRAAIESVNAPEGQG